MPEDFQPDEFIKLLKHEAGIYEKLLELAKEQQEIISSKDANQLLRVLSKKKSLLEGIEEISQKLLPTKQNWATRKKNFLPQQTDEIEKLMKRERVLLEELNELEQKSISQVEANKQNTLQEINKLSSGKKLYNAYGVKPPQKKKNIIDRDG